MNKIILILNCIFLTSCSISFQNISTHGTANDLVDENQTSSPDLDLSIPLNKV